MNSQPSPPLMPAPRRARQGCFVQLLALLALGIVLGLGIPALLMPWAFYMGGQFHIIPQWTGWGRMHSKLAGDYILYVQLSPARPSRYAHNLPYVSGRAVLCTPQGERYKLHLGGDFDKPSGTGLQGKKAHLYMYNYSALSGSTAPSLDFRGKWNNPDLVLDDGGSLTRAFDPGGKLANPHMRPYVQEVAPLTLHQGSWSDFEAACSGIKAR